MATINFNEKKLQTINNDFKYLSNTLSETYYNELESELLLLRMY